MVERRKKTRGSSDEGKAAKKSPRSRKARPEGNGSPTRNSPPAGAKPNQCSDPPENGGQEGQALKDVPPTPDLASQAPKIVLPGEFYLRAGRWWWRVRLPGEDKAKARPLKPEGAKTAAEDRQIAEKIAFEMWEHAVQESAARQIKMESTEKIERLKAQLLDKVRHFTELVQTANAKIEEEAKARAEAEAKLAQMAQAAGPKAEDAGRKTEDRGPRTDEETCPSSVICRPSSDIHLPTPTGEPSPIAPSEDRGPQPPQPAIGTVVPPNLVPAPPLEIGVCECCGATGIATACLTRIDSGQSLCPRCLTALRTDVARIGSGEPA